MIFSSLEFLLLFLPLTLVSFYFLGRLSTKAAVLFLVTASLFFYAYWDITYLPLLLGYAIINYSLGAWLHKNPSKAILACGIALNLGVLALFKYADFFIANIQLAGWDVGFLGIVLPLGISFITFQKISYLVECYRGQITSFSLQNYLLFISFFPQLIAGPIVRFEELDGQFRHPLFGQVQWKSIAAGLFMLSIGLAKKVLFADQLALLVSPVFERAAFDLPISPFDAWQAVTAYSFQIYFDFSGYSDMAIGLGLLLGIRLPDNFTSPYKAANITEFWRCWHMTLSRFLRDYLYIPLGGNRHGPLRRYLNLFIVMLLGGLWHGASWNFVIWGGLHGIYLAIHQALRAIFPDRPLPGGKTMGTVLTFSAVTFAWIFFRAETFSAAQAMIEALVDISPSTAAHAIIDGQPSFFGPALIGISFLLVWFAPNSLQWLARFQSDLQKDSSHFLFPWGWLWTGLALAICVFTIFAGAESEFIYFQF